MKSTFMLLSFLFLPIGLTYAQTVQPTFSTPIYFEDGVGNRDTVRVGYDFAYGQTLTGGPANLYGTPWDSVFEVRVATRIGGVPAHEFKSVNTYYSGSFSTDGSFYGAMPTIILRMNIMHLPLKIILPLVDRQNNRCTQETYIDVAYNWFSFTPPTNCPWVMNSRDTVTEYFQLPRQMCNNRIIDNNEFYSFVLDSIEGGGYDSLREVYLFMRTPLWFVGNEEQQEAPQNIYPNPSGGSFVLDFGDLSSATYQIHDALGRLVVSGQYQPQLQLSLEQPGLYFVSVREEDTGAVRTSKLVVGF